MPGPPTPLSGSPLKRLEIHESSTIKVYDSTQFSSSLTLTLEGQRSKNGENHDLMLQVHCGLQRVLSLKLTELLTLPSSKSDAISAEKSSHRLCVNTQNRGQVYVADFEKARDFNVAAYMLKKFGFHVKDGISLPSPSSATSEPASPLYYAPPNANFGPRLSSITPLPGFDGHGSSDHLQDVSFTSMLNSDIKLIPSNNMLYGTDTHSPIIQPTFGISPVSQDPLMPVTRATLQAGQSHTPLNPYNMFLGRQSNYYHQPRVGSPLRNAIEAEYSQSSSPQILSSTQSMIHICPQSQPLGVSIPSQRSISAPTSYPQSRPIWNRVYFNSNETPNNEPSDDQPASASSSQMDASTLENSSQPAKNFRELMPQPRNLPFLPESKVPDKTAKSKTVKSKASLSKQAKAITSTKKEPRRRAQAGSKTNAMASTEDKDSKPTTRTKKEPQKRPRGKVRSTRSTKIPSKVLKAQQAPKRQYKKMIRIDDQTKAQPEPQLPKSVGLVPENPNGTASLSEKIVTPNMLVADAAILKKVNEATSKLLDQYVADRSRGCDEATCAQFYAEQIHTTRRNIWLAQLTAAERGSGWVSI